MNLFGCLILLPRMTTTKHEDGVGLLERPRFVFGGASYLPPSVSVGKCHGHLCQTKLLVVTGSCCSLIAYLCEHELHLRGTSIQDRPMHVAVWIAGSDGDFMDDFNLLTLLKN